MKTVALLLAGGRGTRMGAELPKQYLELGGKPIAQYSYELFQSMPEIDDIVVVCDSEWQQLFPGARYALPGERRQDSVANGVAAADADYFCIHDAARPFVPEMELRSLLSTAWDCGAAALGVPVKPTIKQVSADGTVVRTPKRSQLWEVQTPQVVEASLLREGLERARAEGWEVSDDLSLVERLGKTARLVPGSYRNLKITTPEDLAIAETILNSQLCYNPRP